MPRVPAQIHSGHLMWWSLVVLLLPSTCYGTQIVLSGHMLNPEGDNPRFVRARENSPVDTGEPATLSLLIIGVILLSTRRKL